MPRVKQPAVRTLWCYMCMKWVDGRQLAGGYYCPSCSGYIPIKNQPAKKATV